MRNRYPTPAVVALSALLVVTACSGGDEGTGNDTTTSAPSSTTTDASPASSTTITAPVAPRPYGGTARYLAAEPVSLNPLIRPGDPAPLEVGATYLVGVMRVSGATGELEPDVVTEVPSTANGGLVEHPDGTLTVRYQILPEAVWADGAPISGDDLAFTYQLHMDPELPTDKTLYEDIIPDSITAGPKSFEYRIDHITPGWATLFDVIVPAHQVAGSDFESDWNEQPWVSGGPFMFAARRACDHIELVRNPNYWASDPATGQTLPYLDSIELGPFAPQLLATIEDPDLRASGEALWCGGEVAPEDEGSAFLAMVDAGYQLLLDGTLDGGPLVAPISAAKRIADLRNSPEVVETKYTTRSFEHLVFQFGPGRLAANADSLVEHVEFRRAIAHAIDRNRLAQEVTGPATGLDSHVDAINPFLSGRAWARYGHDPEGARRLLTELCTRLGRDCDSAPPRLEIAIEPSADGDTQAELITEMLAEVGIEVAVTTDLAIGDLLACSHWEAATWAWSAGPGLAGLTAIYEVWSPDLPPPAGLNYGHWGTPAVTGGLDNPTTQDCDEAEFMNVGASVAQNEFVDQYRQLIDEMSAATDPRLLRGLMLEAETALANQVVFIPLYSSPGSAFWRADHIDGYDLVFAAPAPWNAEFWYRVGG